MLPQTGSGGNVDRPSADVSRADTAVPPNSTFIVPQANACDSRYDKFYEAEPGVYAFWALCEAGTPAQIFDYVGEFDLTKETKSWGPGVVAGGAPGPVPDGETAATVSTSDTAIQNQGIPVNIVEGTISAWIKADQVPHPVTAVFLGAVKGQSQLTIGVSGEKGFCFDGSYVDTLGKPTTLEACGFNANTWHRVLLTWRHTELTLYVDGRPSATASYSGPLDKKLFYYRLFPGCCNTGKEMALAKISVANEAWSGPQATRDSRPTFPPVPTGGVFVTSERLGTIHRDVLGFADMNQDISTPAARAALLSGLGAAGVTAVRYAAGYGGINADLASWRGGTICGHTPGQIAEARNTITANSLDNFLPQVAQPLRLNVVFTVNYSTNPPACNAGGDPIENGANLVTYANLTKRYGIKRWEIGNELFSRSSEADFHDNPHSGATYAQYEPAFYAAMKAQDPTIQIGVPIGLGKYSWQTEFDYPVLASADYDAVIWHSYPMRDPITDGDTLYRDRVASNTKRTHGALLKLQTELLSNGKSADSIWVTEWNGEVSGSKSSKQTMGAVAPLFVASQIAEYMQAGVRVATWWVQGRPNGCSTLNYDGQGETAYSWWECGSTSLVYAGPTAGHGEVETGQRPGDLTPAGRAFQILSQSGFVTEGEHMVRTFADTASAPWLLSYAATHDTSYAVILINRDRDAAHTVPVSLEGKNSGRSVQQWTYGRAQYDRSRTGDWSSAPAHLDSTSRQEIYQPTLPPWSVNILVFQR